MKLKSILSLLAGSMMLLAACTPDEYSLGNQQYTSADLTYPNGYSVTIDGNKVNLESKISGCTPLWITPSGRSQQQNVNLELPFAGDYEVTFGAETRAGAVYGDPYTFTIAQNDFTLLSDAKWFNLADANYRIGAAFPDAATLSAGVSKKWYPNDKDYGLGCTGPVMYMTPYDPTNSGNYTDDEAANGTYKDITFGRANWSPNWDPGYQSWLIPDTDPYMDSYMEFSMDAKNGCVAKMYRGEAGSKGASTGKDMTGKFTLDLSDKLHPTISFSDCYAMHNIGFDEVCANYTNNIIIAELTPYYLCLVTKRTNSEGNWYIVWNFVSEEVKNTNGACIPKEDAALLNVSEPVLPVFANLATDMFAIESNGVTYSGNQITYTVDTDAPYDICQWNGAENANKWENLLNGNYNSTWAPQPDDSYADNELVISKNSDGTYEYSLGDTEGTLTIGKNTLTFSNSVTFVTASSSARSISVSGTEFTVLSESAAEGMTIGIPYAQNAKGNTNSYLTVNLKVKPIGSPQTGPTAVPLTDNYTDEGISWVENNCFRLGFHHYGDGGKGIFKDANSVKLKKGQTIRVKFTLKDASQWSAAPKCALIDNNIKTTWEPGCFDLDDAVTVNLSGETVVTLTNTTDATQKFTGSCLDLSIQLDGFLIGFDKEVTPDIIQSVSCEIE